MKTTHLILVATTVNLMKPLNLIFYIDILGLKENIVIRFEKGMFRYFGHLERLDYSKLMKGIVMEEVAHGEHISMKWVISLEKSRVKSTSN